MDTNALYMEHYIDLHNYISDNIYELDDNVILEGINIGQWFEKGKEAGQNAVKWLCNTIQKLWHFITKWFTGTQRKARQAKLKDLMSETKKEEIAKQKLDDISKAISEEYKKDKKYHLLDLKDKDFDAIAEEILKYCRNKNSILDFYLDEEEDFEKLHKIIKILDKISTAMISRETFDADRNWRLDILDDLINNKGKKPIQSILRQLFILDPLMNITDFMHKLNIILKKINKEEIVSIDEEWLNRIKMGYKNNDSNKFLDKENTMKYISLLKNIKTIQKFFIHYIKMLDLLIASINNVCNITDAEIVGEKKESWIARLFKPKSKLIDRENAIANFPPFTEKEIDEALDILEIVKDLYKYRI